MPLSTRNRIRAAVRRVSTLVVGVAALGAGGAAHAFDRDSLVWRKCTPCHAADADGRISRVEERRTTPEEWTVIVDRMRRLHDMPIAQGEMDRLLKELTSTQILTPEEQAQVAYLSLWHNSQQVETPHGKADEQFFTTCVRCHTAGKIRSYRMTAQAWSRMRDFHLYILPTVVFQMREMRWIPEADTALAYLAKQLPYDKPWTAPAARLAGAWRVFGWQSGRGAYRGQARIADAGNSEYRLSGTLAYADGMSESFAGEATLYGGYALRTRTKSNGVDTRGAFIVDGAGMRGEWHRPAPDFLTSQTTWLRDDGAAKVARVLPGFVLRGEKTTLTVEGVNLPDAKPADVSFGGAAVKVLSVRRIDPGTMQLEVVSSADKVATARLTLGGVAAGTVTLAPRIDHIAVTPELGRARISAGANYPAEGVQFEAIAYAKGGGKPVALGPVPATFRLADEKTRPDYDDLRWLGAIQANGNYVPMAEYGPNPTRKFSRENSGLVKVLAQYKRGAQTYSAQALLAVTLPDLIARIR